MGNLNECYWQIKQAMSFLSAMMVDLLNNDPNVQAAVAAAIAKAGPLAIQGITTGVAATPGTVGETFQNTVAGLPYGATYTSQVAALGILPAGDWILWVSINTATTPLTVVTGSWGGTNPVGFGPMSLAGGLPTQGTVGSVVSNPCQALISTPTLMNALIGVQGTAAGTCSATVFALRVR